MSRVSVRLAELLAARREALNAHFRRAGRGVDPQAFLGFLQRAAPPVVAATSDAAAPAVLDALFQVGLRAMRRGLVSDGQSTDLERALLPALARLGRHLEAAPTPLVAGLGNAFDRLARELGAGVARAWLEALVAVADACADRDDLDAAALVLAWRHGLAEAREAAIVRSRSLPLPLRTRLLGAESVDTSPERRFVRPGCAAPLGPLGLVGPVGAFVGFGGDFRRPPLVYAVDGLVYASDEQTVHVLHADCFGLRLRAAGLDPRTLALHRRQDPSLRVLEGGLVRWGELTTHLPQLADAQSQAAVPGLVAVTLKSSHHVFVLGRREAEA